MRRTGELHNRKDYCSKESFTGERSGGKEVEREPLVDLETGRVKGEYILEHHVRLDQYKGNDRLCLLCHEPIQILKHVKEDTYYYIGVEHVEIGMGDKYLIHRKNCLPELKRHIVPGKSDVTEEKSEKKEEEKENTNEKTEDEDQCHLKTESEMVDIEIKKLNDEISQSKAEEKPKSEPAQQNEKVPAIKAESGGGNSKSKMSAPLPKSLNKV